MSQHAFALNISRQNAVRSIALVIFASVMTTLMMVLMSEFTTIFDGTHIIFPIKLSLIFFVLMCIFFNIVVWRWSLLHRLKLINYPDLNGTWTGYLTSSWTEHGKLYPITITIQQTWLWIEIEFKTADSSSLSVTTAITQNPDGDYQLQYIYAAQPSTEQFPDWKPFQGLCVLTLRDGNSLSGYYEYFDRKSQQGIHGQVYIERHRVGGTTTPKGDLHLQE